MVANRQRGSRRGGHLLSTLSNSHWNYLMAATVVAIIPPLALFFFAQRYFIEGAVLTGVKG